MPKHYLTNPKYTNRVALLTGFFQTSSSSSVMEHEKNLRNRYEVLSKEKLDRMSKLKHLVNIDRELSTRLKVTPLEVSSESVPSSSQLDLFKARIEERKQEMV